jgi:hypothetical protein
LANQNHRKDTDFGSFVNKKSAPAVKIRAAGWPDANSAALPFAKTSKRLVVVFGLGRSPKQPSPQILLFFLCLISFFSLR